MSAEFSRIYDVAMSDELRAAVRERRKNPDGKLLHPKIEIRGDSEILVYPWSEMKLGDFFYVPLLDRKPGPLSIRLRQAAARRDWELTIIQWKQGTSDVLRVCLTLLDISEIKRKAQQHHEVRHIRFGDGKWSNTRKARYRRHKGKPRLAVVSNVERTSPPPDRANETQQSVEAVPLIVAQPEQSPVEVDASLSPEYDRDQIVRERLAALGIKP